MNLEESNSFIQEEAKKDRKKKVVIASIVLCSLLIVLLFCCIFAIQYQDSQTLKMFINGTEQPISATLLREIDGNMYINLSEMAQKLGFTYTKGEYNKYNEDEKSGYITNQFEVSAFTAEQDSFNKYALEVEEEILISEIPVTTKLEVGVAQKYSLEQPVKFEEGALYVPFESMTDIFNVQLNLSQENRIKIFTFEQVIGSVKNSIGKLGYTSISGDYENLKAGLYGLAVVGNGTTFGVIDLTKQTENEVIGFKYEDITFLQNLKNFLVKGGNTVGIFDSTGKDVISPSEYDEISVYDEDAQLYLVKKDDKYGVLNRLGKTIVYPDYDEIGYTVSKEREKIEYKILFDKCIPVKEGSKFGLYSIEGEELLPCLYDEFGSELSMTEDVVSSNEKSVLEIPRELGIEGLVINQNGMYGIYDINSESIIIPIVCSRVYSITKAAKTTYYVVFNGEIINLEEYLEIRNLKSIKEEKETTVDNTITSEETTETSFTTTDGNPSNEPTEENETEEQTPNETTNEGESTVDTQTE